MALKQSLGVTCPEVITGNTECTSFSTPIRVGNVADNATQYQSNGVPQTAVPFVYKLQAPPAADVDYYRASGTATSGLLTLTNTTLTLNEAAGEPFCRNVVVDPSGSTSGSLRFTVEDANGQIVQRTVTFAASGTTIETAWTCRRIVSVEVLASFEAVTIEIGFGDVFGLKYPAYLNTAISAGIDAAGDDFPAPIATDFVITTDWTFTPGVADSTTADHYGTFNLVAADTNPDGTADYAMLYLAHEIYIASFASRYTDSYGNGAWVTL